MTTRRVVLSFFADVALVLAFAATGRASHDEAVLAGLWQTVWPFLAALVAGWAACMAWRAPTRPLRTGIPVWAVTLAGGMLLRIVSGQGTALPFVLVAAGALLLVLVGWRLIAALVMARVKARGRARTAGAQR